MQNINNNIHVGKILSNNLDLLQKYLPSTQILIVTDTNVAKLHLADLLLCLQQYSPKVVELLPGEEHKTWLAVETILSALKEYKFDRSATIISLGGGIVGDLSGFAAALYMRGINWLQIPTTLLAQVDAAIGGKTGCNHLGIKNLIGTFYFPNAIFADISLLKTLPEREYIAGLAEVVKYGFACDAEFFIWLESEYKAIKARNEPILEQMVARCCAIKQAIVASDVHDRQQRQILNFGHSFAHAIEAATGFKYYLHGEAVALGMLLASRLAVKIGILERAIFDRLVKLLECLDLNLTLERDICSPDMLSDYIKYDKKKQAGTINLILPCELGRAIIMSEHEVSIEDIYV